MIKVSVIIPTWNRAYETRRAVESVLKQTYQDFEILIVDDGSTDSTQQKFTNFADNRVKYVRINHSGLPAVTRNVGINLAKGEYIAFLDSDDEWLPNKLSLQINKINTDNQIGLVCTNGFRIQTQNKNKIERYFKHRVSISDSLEDLVKYSNFVITSSVLLRRTILDMVGLFSEDPIYQANDDFELWIRVANVCKIAYLNTPLIKYYDHSSSIRSIVSNNIYEKSMFDIYGKVVESLRKRSNISDNFESLLVRRIYTLAIDPDKYPTSTFIDRNPHPKVSVILPVYNGEKYISKSISSILTQTFTNFELIIINDGSIDHTKDLLKTIDDSRVRIFNQPNRGIVASLNLGIENAKGEYIARQDHDDIAFPTRLEKQVKFLDSNLDYGLVGTNAEIWENNIYCGKRIIFPNDDLVLKYCLLFNNPFVHSSVMFRKDIVDRVGGYDNAFNNSAMEDYELWSRISKVCRVSNLPDVLQVYCRVSTSITHRVKNNFLFREKIAYKNFFEYLKTDTYNRYIRHLLVLEFKNFNLFDASIPFLECKKVYYNTVKALLHKENKDISELTLEYKSFINRLGWTHFAYKFHFPFIIINTFDNIFNYPLLMVFEYWEYKSPKSFARFSKKINSINRFLYTILCRSKSRNLET